VKTTQFLSGLAGARARLAFLSAAFVAAMVGLAAPAHATLTAISLNPTALAVARGASASTQVTVTKNNSNNNSSAALSITWTGGTPTGVTAGFVPSSVSWGGSGGDRTSTLTISTTAATPVNTYTFTVRAQRSGGDFQTTTGTLVVSLPAPAITFAAAPTPTYLGGDFTVNATTNSDGALSYGYVSGPCAQVSAGTFSSSGAGTCVVQASTAATSSYAAGSAQQSVTIAKAGQTITFGALADKTVGDADFPVSATASSGLTVTFTAGGNCTVTGTLVHLTGYGSCLITAAQAGDANFLAAASVGQSFTILPAAGSYTSFDLYAAAGSASLPNASVPVWGYTADGGAVGQPGGPTLVVDEGAVVVVTLHNNLAEASGVQFQGQDMVPDTTGAAAGATKSYIFTASRPGTYLYEAGLLPNTQHQVAMGLYGALVVNSATAGQAYDDPATAYDKDAVLVLSEIDPALNTASDPAAFDMREYAPRYFLINGKAYPGTDTIDAITATNSTGAGNKVLLRYVNAGAKHHSMAVLGLRQNFVAKDAGLLPTLMHNVAAETLSPGQTADAIAVIPAVTTASQFAVYDASLMLHNSGAAGFGGMLTFVTAGSGSSVAGPATSGITLTPPRTAGGNVALSASIGSASTTVTAAEYFIDSPGAAGSGTAMSGPFGSGPVAVSATIDAGTLASGNHTIYVHGTDGTNWGGFGSSTLVVDKTGPSSTGLSLTPNPSNGSVNVALHATGDDTATGGSNITAAEYFIGATGANGSGTAMTVNAASPVASLDATIAAPVTGGVVSVHSMDALGNWGSFATVTLNVGTTGPTTSVSSVEKTPNNGTIPLNSSQAVVRVTATMTAATGSTVAGAEAFFCMNADPCLPGATGTGFPLVPGDGSWNGNSETGYADIPLGTVAQMADGNHTISVHGRDGSGNWGGFSTGLLVIDKTAPTISSASLSAGTIAFSTPSVTLNVTASDGTGTGVTGGQYAIDGGTPVAFAGASVAIGTSALAGGSHTVAVQMKDAVGNLSAASNLTLYVVQAVADAKSFNATGANGIQTQSYNTTGSSLLANDFPTNGTAALVSAPVRIGGTGTVTPYLTCTSGTAAPAVGGSTICTNGRFTVNLPDPGGNNNAQMAGRRGTYTFTYTVTSGGVTSPPATVTITVN
jgi:hypothetical protein